MREMKNKEKKVVVNNQDLRKRLIATFNGLESGEINYKQAGELSRVAGRMLASAKLDLQYAVVRGEKPQIEFLEG